MTRHRRIASSERVINTSRSPRTWRRVKRHRPRRWRAGCKARGIRRTFWAQFSELGTAVEADSKGRLYWTPNSAGPGPSSTLTMRLNGWSKLTTRSAVKVDRPKLRVKPCTHPRGTSSGARDGGAEHVEPARPTARPSSNRSTARAPDSQDRRSRVGRLAHAEEVVSSWMEIPDQKATTLGDFSLIGGGYATAKDGTPYWYVLLAEQPAALKPSTDIDRQICLCQRPTIRPLGNDCLIPGGFTNMKGHRWLVPASLALLAAAGCQSSPAHRGALAASEPALNVPGDPAPGSSQPSPPAPWASLTGIRCSRNRASTT